MFRRRTWYRLLNRFRMSMRFRAAVLLICVGFIAFGIFFRGSLHLKLPEVKFRFFQTTERDFSAEQKPIKASSCKIPVVDAFHPSVTKFVRDLDKLRCDGVSYSSFENNHLHVLGVGISSVKYRTIGRTPGDDFGVVLSEPVDVASLATEAEESKHIEGTFVGNATIDSDFIRVEVVTTSGQTASDVHMQVSPKKEVVGRTLKPGGIPLDVALVMFDSTSAANFRRKLPNSFEYLTKNLDSVFMQGQTVVGDGTTPNLCAMLTGIAEKHQPEARRKKSDSRTIDDWGWIFKDFKQKGYATMFSEDSPHLASFNYRLHGFRDPPTDHYARPFWLEADKIVGGYCINSRASHEISLSYLLNYFRVYKHRPKFSFISHAVISHDDPNTVGYADDDLKNFLQAMEKSFLNSTFLVIFADHGARFSGLRKTIQGKLEERLPFLSITTPKWFSEKYPDLYSNLVHNSQVLTTPFDMYATLRHIMSYPEYPSGISTGQSLFNRIDGENRTCANAGVEDHWCPCLNLEEVSIYDEPVVNKSAEMVVKHINSLTSQNAKLSKLCHRLVLKEIKSAFRDMPSEAMQTFKDTKHAQNDTCDYCVAVMGDKAENTLAKDTLYQLQLVTSPNEGFYEASVRVKKGVPSLVGDISRIDAYKDQPYCVQDNYPLLRKFCFCSR